MHKRKRTMDDRKPPEEMRASDRERAYAMSITPLERGLMRVLGVMAFVTMVGLFVWVDRVLWGPW